ncbi:cyclic nucleotide-binding and patatin-like phospholipase domain-containing protein [Niveibacterium microcysteis]|uniref:Patatin-like phospholipase family protein n=1 Tax=Niveibacterium microcysteis TaxID=2811415 RepID=A0ABX7M9M3_9RHOO|nr:cyclic nucleotide-binding and patatin-like phospholipase domain-containing protein [Niveibacterium microcysteis]QSI78440.1 patatin-like phospholipase family protein [Niveibacterium microcysteis]
MPDASYDAARIGDILRGSRLFGQINDAALSQLVALLKPVRKAAGEVVYREKEPSGSLVIVLAGRLRVSRNDREGNLLLYNELCPGECIGETGMILQQPRTADVVALRDSTVAELSRADYETLLQQNPLVFSQIFSQAIYHYLRHLPQIAERKRAQAFAIIPLHRGEEAALLARGLAQAFAARRVTHLRPPSPGEAADDQAIARRLGTVDAMEVSADFILYEAEAALSPWTKFAVRQADQVIFVARSTDTPTVGALEQQLRMEPGLTYKRQHLVLLHPAGTSVPTAPTPWRAAREVERIYLQRHDAPGDHESLARFLTGHATGIVLGGGGARGFAHLGVLRALEEANIPIDLIGGNSMGALIGAQYACGIGFDDIRENILRFTRTGERPSLPVISVLSGRRIERELRRLFGDATADALWRPYFAAACNLSQACTTVQDTGPLWRAVLASNSPAGLLPPVLLNGDLLVDGAILDNVPVEAMRTRLGTKLEKRRGNGTVIAVDVDVREALQVDAEVKRLSPWRKIRGHMSADAPVVPGIGDILYRASHMGGLTQRGRTIALSDYYLEPPVAEFPLMAYRRAREIAEAGYRYASAEIERWDRQNFAL